jgi:glycosyltransferase involved in cell wall biosynthesis
MIEKKINLLIITQKVDLNDPVLGFFHGWLKEFAKHCNKLTVICLEKGDYELPENVKVLSLGKDGGESKAKYLHKFYKYIRQEKDNYDSVFVHMNPIYVILGGLFWRSSGKKIALWYTHKSVDLKLKLAEKLSHIIFTASKESFRLNTRKLVVTGHGIDTEIFKPKDNQHTRLNEILDTKGVGDKFNIVSVGRISPVKNYEILIDAIKILSQDNANTGLKIIGGPGTKDQKVYLEQLKKKVQDSGLSEVVEFVGEVTNKETVKYLQNADVFVNLSHTGSLDKAVLEAMACGLPVVTTNEGLKSTLGEGLVYTSDDPKGLALKIKYILRMPYKAHDVSGISYRTEKDRLAIGRVLRETIIEDHNLSRLISKLVLKMN